MGGYVFAIAASPKPCKNNCLEENNSSVSDKVLLPRYLQKNILLQLLRLVSFLTKEPDFRVG